MSAFMTETDLRLKIGDEAVDNIRQAAQLLDASMREAVRARLTALEVLCPTPHAQQSAIVTALSTFTCEMLVSVCGGDRAKFDYAVASVANGLQQGFPAVMERLRKQGMLLS